MRRSLALEEMGRDRSIKSRDLALLFSLTDWHGYVMDHLKKAAVPPYVCGTKSVGPRGHVFLGARKSNISMEVCLLGSRGLVTCLPP